MGDMADFVNDSGDYAAMYEEDVLARGDPSEMYDAGICDEQGFVDWVHNPPGFAGLVRGPTKSNPVICRCCGSKGLIWKSLNGKWRLFDQNEIHNCPVNPLR